MTSREVFCWHDNCIIASYLSLPKCIAIIFKSHFSVYEHLPFLFRWSEQTPRRMFYRKAQNFCKSKTLVWVISKINVALKCFRKQNANRKPSNVSLGRPAIVLGEKTQGDIWIIITFFVSKLIPDFWGRIGCIFSADCLLVWTLASLTGLILLTASLLLTEEAS